MKEPVRITDWCVIDGDHVDDLTPPELITRHLWGRISGHPKLKDGELIRTSRIIGKKGELIVTKSGLLYQLIKVRPDYGIKFTDPKGLLLKSLPELKEKKL